MKSTFNNQKNSNQFNNTKLENFCFQKSFYSQNIVIMISQ